MNRELNRYLDLTDALQFSNPIENITLGDCALNTWQQDNNYYPDEQEFDFIYDLSMERQKIKELKINFGSSDITRFSCTCHKLNVVVRHAISNHELGEILRKLSKSNATVRNSISLNRFFKDHKFRLRLESPTRWGSAFLVLESVKQAYDRGAFSGDLACPISLATIETYIKVLKPAYELSTTLQLKASSTCDVIPSLIHLMTHWETLAVCGAPKELCYRLITNLKSKFRYEFSSPCYRSAPILKIANIKYWMDKTYSKKLISEGLHSLKEAYKLLCYRVPSEEVDTPPISAKSTSSEPSTGRFFSNICSGDSDLPDENGGNLFIMENELDKEISFFAKILINKAGLKCTDFIKY